MVETKIIVTRERKFAADGGKYLDDSVNSGVEITIHSTKKLSDAKLKKKLKKLGKIVGDDVERKMGEMQAKNSGLVKKK